MSAVTREGLPVALPSSTAVRTVSQKAARAIDAFHALDVSLPARRTDEQLNELDALRNEAFGLLMGPSVQPAIEKERRERAVKMRVALAEVSRLLSEEEASKALERWRGNPTSYSIRGEPGLVISVGIGGYKTSLTARQLLGRLQGLFPTPVDDEVAS